jgi:hypothetical protein
MSTMTDQEIIQALNEYRQQKLAGQMQNMLAQAMFGVQSSIPEKSKILETIEQVEQAEKKLGLDFQNPKDTDSQTILNLLLDL